VGATGYWLRAPDKPITVEILAGNDARLESSGQSSEFFA
jgi:hypothetical protein